MSCERYREAVTDAAAGMPLPAEVEAHVAGCEACRSELQNLRQALAMADTVLRELGSAEPGPWLRARIREAVAGEVDAKRRARWQPSRVAAAALAIAALLVVAALVVPWRTASLARPPEAESVPANVAPSTAAADSAGPGLAGESSPRLEPGRRPVGGRAVPTASPARGAARAVTPEPRAASGREEPEVLVPPGQTEILLRFAELIQRERVAPASLMAVGQPSTDLAGPAPLEIQPLGIVPLEPAETPGT